MKTLIYKITNLINGKCYIGQTCQGLARRKGEHVYRANLGERDHKLYLAIRKYGLSNFRMEPVFYVFEETQLDEFEKLFIEQHNSFNRGYNMTSGDNRASAQTRAKISKAHSGRKITWYHKIVEARKSNGTYGLNVKTYKIKHPSGIIEIVTNMKKFCIEHGLDNANLIKTLKGRNCCKGFVVIERLNDYSERKYTQVGGSAEYPVSLAG